MTPGGNQKMVIINVDPEDRTVNESFTVNGTHVTLINKSGLSYPAAPPGIKVMLYILFMFF